MYNPYNQNNLHNPPNPPLYINLNDDHDNNSDLEFKKFQESLLNSIKSESIKTAEEEKKIRYASPFSIKLIPYLIDSDDDNIILPENCLRELEDRHLFTDVLTFEVCTNQLVKQVENQNSKYKFKPTYCGVKEFTAIDDCVGLPKKVILSLGLDNFNDVNSLEQVKISYVKLPKCSYVKFQPFKNSFSQIMEIKTCFEQNLKLNTTLALNDILSVWYHGTKHDVKVIDIKPENACRIIDTDIEVDFDVSVEYKEHLARVEEEAKEKARLEAEAKALRLAEAEAKERAEAERKAKERAEAEKRKLKNIGNTNIDTTVSKSKTTSSFQNIKNNLIEIRDEPVKLNEEEIANGIKIITLKFRLPDKVVTRKFKTNDTINYLFGFIAKEHLSYVDINNIKLTSIGSNQTITLTECNDLTLDNLGITVNQVLSVMIDE